MFMHSLTLRNILSFRDPEPLALRPLNILIGPNASGKSNFIDCIELLKVLPENVNRYVNRRGGIDSWIWKGSKPQHEPSRIDCRFELDGPRDYTFTFSAIGQLIAIEKESLGSNDSGEPFLSRNFHDLRISKGDPSDGYNNSTVDVLESALAAYRNPLDPTPITRAAQALSSIRIYKNFLVGEGTDIRSGGLSSSMKHPLEETGANLALVLQEMDFRGSLRMVEQYLNRLSDRFEEIKINLEGGRAQIYLVERGLDKVSATRLSDGTLRFLCLMAVLFDHEPAPLVCIEEPEIGLHPDALSLVADALRDASTRTQLIVTTHSDALVDRFSDEPESVVVCDRDFDESTRFRRLSADDLKEWLEDYTLGELWKRGEIGGTQR
jgi:predicted ATPase